MSDWGVNEWGVTSVFRKYMVSLSWRTEVFVDLKMYTVNIVLVKVQQRIFFNTLELIVKTYHISWHWMVDGSHLRWNKNKLGLHLTRDQSQGLCCWEQQEKVFLFTSYLNILTKWDALSDVSFNMCENGKSRTASSAVPYKFELCCCCLIFSYKCHVHIGGRL